jgi:hypothetical protein
MGLLDLLVVLAENFDQIHSGAVKVAIGQIFKWFEQIAVRVKD